MGCNEIEAPEVPEVDVSKLKGNIADQLPEGMSVDNLKQQAANPQFSSKLGLSVGLTGKNLRAKFSKESIKTATGISFDNPLQAVGDAIGNAIGGLVDGIAGAITGAIDSVTSLGSQIKNFKPGSLSLDSPEGMFGSIKNKNLQQRIQEFEANRAARLASKCGDEFAKETTKVNKKIKEKTETKAAAITPKEKVEIQKDPVKAEQKQEQIKEEVKQELKQEAEQEAVTEPKEERVIQDEVQAEKVKEIKLNMLSDIFLKSPTEAELNAGGVRMISTDKGEDWPFIYYGRPGRDRSELEIRETIKVTKELLKEKNSWKVTVTDTLTYSDGSWYLVWIKPLDGDFIGAYDQNLSSRTAVTSNTHSTVRAELERARTIQWYRWYGNGGETIRKPDGTIGYIEDENFTTRDAANYNALVVQAQDRGKIRWKANPLHYLENSSLPVPSFKNHGLYPGRSQFGHDKVFLPRVVSEDIIDCRRENYQKHGIYKDETKTELFDYADFVSPCTEEEQYSRTEERVLVTVPINEPIDNNSRFLAFTEAFDIALTRQQEIIETNQRDDSNDQLEFPNPRTGGMSPLPYAFMDQEQKEKHMHIQTRVGRVRNGINYEGGKQGFASGKQGTKYVSKKIFVSANWGDGETVIVDDLQLEETGETFAQAGRKASVNGLKATSTIVANTAAELFA